VKYFQLKSFPPDDNIKMNLRETRC